MIFIALGIVLPVGPAWASYARASVMSRPRNSVNREGTCRQCLRRRISFGEEVPCFRPRTSFSGEVPYLRPWACLLAKSHPVDCINDNRNCQRRSKGPGVSVSYGRSLKGSDQSPRISYILFRNEVVIIFKVLRAWRNCNACNTVVTHGCRKSRLNFYFERK